MQRREDLVSYDFQGWPIFKMTLKEVLLGLGGKIIDDKHILFDDEKMNLYPRIFIDDGMAYGVDECYITEVSCGKDFINIFREPIPSKKRYKELLERWDEDTKLINNA